MAEHALNISQQLKGEEFVPHSRILSDYVHRRASGEPLQYILGSEYFGELEIKCRPGVLIPRCAVMDRSNERALSDNCVI